MKLVILLPLMSKEEEGLLIMLFKSDLKTAISKRVILLFCSPMLE